MLVFHMRAPFARAMKAEVTSACTSSDCTVKLGVPVGAVIHRLEPSRRVPIDRTVQAYDTSGN